MLQTERCNPTTGDGAASGEPCRLRGELLGGLRTRPPARTSRRTLDRDRGRRGDDERRGAGDGEGERRSAGGAQPGDEERPEGREAVPRVVVEAEDATADVVGACELDR